MTSVRPHDAYFMEPRKVRDGHTFQVGPNKCCWDWQCCNKSKSDKSLKVIRQKLGQSTTEEPSHMRVRDDKLQRPSTTTAMLETCLRGTTGHLAHDTAAVLQSSTVSTMKAGPVLEQLLVLGGCKNSNCALS